jgi:hypothetical protein
VRASGFGSDCHLQALYRGHCARLSRRHRERIDMAKGQAKSNKETRKPKAEKPKKPNASNPSTK